MGNFNGNWPDDCRDLARMFHESPAATAIHEISGLYQALLDFVDMLIIQFMNSL
jgi:hypothetical protein